MPGGEHMEMPEEIYGEEEPLMKDPPVEILRKVRQTLGAPVVDEGGEAVDAGPATEAQRKWEPESSGGSMKKKPGGHQSVTLSDVLKIKQSKDDEQKVKGFDHITTGGGSGGGGGGGDGEQTLRKLDLLLKKQEETNKKFERIEQRLARLDQISESVATIKLTLRQASQANIASRPYTPPRPPLRLPGQSRHPTRPTPQSGGSDAYHA